MAAENTAEAALPLEVDENEASNLDDNASDTTSIASTLLKGRMENGRRYAALRDDYWGPSDEQQFETMDQVHFTYLLLRSNRDNILFAAPLESPKRILDIGTGPGIYSVSLKDSVLSILT